MNRIRLPIDPETVKGFMDPKEGEALYRAARDVARSGPCLEIGSYCGKSALYIGQACRACGSILFTVDHHRGSEENQPGWEYHDPDTWDEDLGAMDTLPFLRATLRAADLENTVIPIIGRSDIVGRYWQTPLAFLFIDGGHTQEAAHADYDIWTPHLMPNGVLAIHDVFPDPRDGGRPPFEIYQRAVQSGRFEDVDQVGSLRILRCLPGGDK